MIQMIQKLVMLFLHELCNDVLGVTVGSGDVEGLYILGKRKDDQIRPMMFTEELGRTVVQTVTS